MKIREGAYYVTKGGHTVGLATPNPYSSYPWNIPINGGFLAYRDDGTICISDRDWDIASEVHPLWRDMTPEQKGALLLAHHEGKVVETLFGDKWTAVEPEWSDDAAYRVAPKLEVVEITGLIDHDNKWWDGHKTPWVNCKITFDLLDGEPVLGSIKMEKV